MKNLEQIRAANALQAAEDEIFKGKQGGEVAKKVPTMIRENGILATLAFACERKKGDGNGEGKLSNPGHYKVFEAVTRHLGDPAVKKLSTTCKPEELLKFLTESKSATSARLRAITAETMAYLNYLRRFAGK